MNFGARYAAGLFSAERGQDGLTPLRTLDAMIRAGWGDFRQTDIPRDWRMRPPVRHEQLQAQRQYPGDMHD